MKLKITTSGNAATFGRRGGSKGAKTGRKVAAEKRRKGKEEGLGTSASVEAELEVKDWSQQKRARQSRTNGSVKKVDHSPDD